MTGTDQIREYLKDLLYTDQEASDWIEGRITTYIREKYDGELGWLPIEGQYKHGIDDAVCTYSYDDTTSRRMIMYADKPCRVNTYGDSFTHCDQVSDGETWQEVLAAHLCEPIRNFGVSGFSVYQAYRRLKREEARTPAEYIIFNIYSHDHYRNVGAWGPGGSKRPTAPYLKVNPATGEFVELENPCPTPKSLYNRSVLDWLYETFKDDFRLKILLARRNLEANTPERSYAAISDLAAEHGMSVVVDSPKSLHQTAETLFTKAGLFASMRIVEKVEELAAARGKKVLYVLSHVFRHAARTLRDGFRFDQEFVDFLREKGLPYVDLLEAHQAEFAQFNTSVEDYFNRYYIGHYNPWGNFFQALAIKDQLVKLLDPKPVSYRTVA